MDVLKRINRLRLERDWSIYRLSLESNIPQSTLTNMFNRETQPSIATLELLCGAFGITLSEFFDEEEEVQADAVDDKDLLKVFQSLSDHEKRLVLDLMKELNKK